MFVASGRLIFVVAPQRDARVRVAHQVLHHRDRRALREQSAREAMAQGLHVAASQSCAPAGRIDARVQDARSPQRFTVSSSTSPVCGELLIFDTNQ
jgi:hypothetical protein